MAIQRRFFGITGAAERHGEWTQSFLAGINSVVEQRRSMMGLATDGAAATPSEGWMGWQLFYNAGVRPCPAHGSVRDFTFDEVRTRPEPQVGEPMCRYVRHLSCPAPTGPVRAPRPGLLCSMTPEELYNELRRQVTAEAVNAASTVSTPVADPLMLTVTAATEPAQPPFCRGLVRETNTPTALGRLYDIPVEWSPHVAELEAEVDLLEDDAQYPWESVGNGDGGVNIRIVSMDGTYLQFIDSVARYVLQGYFNSLRRSASWNVLIADRFPDRAWRAMFERPTTSMRRYYDDLTADPRMATRTRRHLEIFDIELTGERASAAASALLVELDSQIPAFHRELVEATSPVIAATEERACSRRSTADIVSATAAYYARQRTTATSTALAVSRGRAFRGVQVTSQARTLTVENSESGGTSLVVSPPTGYPAAIEQQLNAAPFSLVGAKAFKRYVVTLPDGRVVVRFVLNGRTEVVETTAMRLANGELNPELFRAGNPRRGIRPGPLRVAMESKTQALLYRDLAFHLFQQNRMLFNSRACAQANLNCVWNARAMAEALFPEHLFEGETLGTMGTRGPPVSSSLGEPSLYERVHSFDTHLYVQALSLPNDWDPIPTR